MAHPVLALSYLEFNMLKAELLVPLTELALPPLSLSQPTAPSCPSQEPRVLLGPSHHVPLDSNAHQVQTFYSLIILDPPPPCSCTTLVLLALPACPVCFPLPPWSPLYRDLTSHRPALSNSPRLLPRKNPNAFPWHSRHSMTRPLLTPWLTRGLLAPH